MSPIVLLHGFTGGPECWREVITRAAGRQTFAYTLLGHEWEGAEVPAATFDAEVERLAGLVREDCEGKARLCGYSMGGRVALVMLARHPELFSSAVLVGASPGLPLDASLRSERAAADAEWIDLARRRGLEAFIDAWEKQPLFASQARLPVAVVAEQRRRRLRLRVEGLAVAMQTLGLAAMPNMWPELETIATRVQLVAGELDTKFRGIAERMRSALPSSTLHVVENAGHNVVLERPDALTELLLDAS